jgi:hypothetical protein
MLYHIIYEDANAIKLFKHGQITGRHYRYDQTFSSMIKNPVAAELCIRVHQPIEGDQLTIMTK